MASFTERLSYMPGFMGLTAVTQEQRERAEHELNLCFSNEFSDYVETFGVATVHGHEFTGVCPSPQLNVVHVTRDEWEQNPEVPKDWYVVEQAHIDGIVIWQNQRGEVFQTMPGAKPVKLCDSLCEYLDL